MASLRWALSSTTEGIDASLADRKTTLKISTRNVSANSATMSLLNATARNRTNRAMSVMTIRRLRSYRSAMTPPSGPKMTLGSSRISSNVPRANRPAWALAPSRAGTSAVSAAKPIQSPSAEMNDEANHSR